MKLHKLSIINDVLYLDGFELKGVSAYMLKREAKKNTELTLALSIETCEQLEPQPCCDDVSSDLRDDI